MPMFDALGSARQPFFLLLIQKKEGKENDPRRLAPCLRRRFPVLLGQNRRCGTVSGLPWPSPCGRRKRRQADSCLLYRHALHGSDSPRFSRFCPVMLGGVNGIRVHHPPSVGRAGPAAGCRAQPDLPSTPSPRCSRASQPWGAPPRTSKLGPRRQALETLVQIPPNPR